ESTTLPATCTNTNSTFRPVPDDSLPVRPDKKPAPCRTRHKAGKNKHPEPQVGIEPTTARLRIECSTTELLWRCAEPTRQAPDGAHRPFCRRPTRGLQLTMPWRGFEPRRLSAPPPQAGVSTSFTTRAHPSSPSPSPPLNSNAPT